MSTLKAITVPNEKLDETLDSIKIAPSPDGCLEQEFYALPCGDNHTTIVYRPVRESSSFTGYYTPRRKSPKVTRITIKKRLEKLLPPGVFVYVHKEGDEFQLVSHLGRVRATAKTLHGLNRKVKPVVAEAWKWWDARNEYRDEFIITDDPPTETF